MVTPLEWEVVVFKSAMESVLLVPLNEWDKPNMASLPQDEEKEWDQPNKSFKMIHFLRGEPDPPGDVGYAFGEHIRWTSHRVHMSN